MSIRYFAGFFRVMDKDGKELATFKSLDSLLNYVEVCTEVEEEKCQSQIHRS